jgi:hypothetical protein
MPQNLVRIGSPGIPTINFFAVPLDLIVCRVV